MALPWPSFTPTYHHKSYATIDETDPALSCAGKVIFITGGGRGIGRAIAKSFATAGAHGIFIVGRNEKSLQDTVGEISTVNTSTKMGYAVADIVDAASVSAAFDKAISSFGRIDVLIQNAGYLDEHRTIADSDLDDYWKTFEINVKGGLNVVQGFIRRTPEPGCTIINIGSGAGHIDYIPGYSAYSSSKLAFAKIVEYVQHENPALRVFNINPGAIATDMQAKAGDIAAPDDIGKFLVHSSCAISGE
jgi:NAD(P)-dependent dehydrogenase (short-subunit alcohol dehydrogenase family)